LFSASVPEGVKTVGSFVAQIDCLDADDDSPNNVITNYQISPDPAGEYTVRSESEMGSRWY